MPLVTLLLSGKSSIYSSPYLVLLMVLIAVHFRWFLPPPAPLRFSLRTLLIAVTLGCRSAGADRLDGIRR